MYPVVQFACFLHFQASDAGEAMLINKNQFRKLYLKWESDHVTLLGFRLLNYQGALSTAVPSRKPGQPCLAVQTCLAPPACPERCPCGWLFTAASAPCTGSSPSWGGLPPPSSSHLSRFQGFLSHRRLPWSPQTGWESFLLCSCDTLLCVKYCCVCPLVCALPGRCLANTCWTNRWSPLLDCILMICWWVGLSPPLKFEGGDRACLASHTQCPTKILTMFEWKAHEAALCGEHFRGKGVFFALQSFICSPECVVRTTSCSAKESQNAVGYQLCPETLASPPACFPNGSASSCGKVVIGVFIPPRKPLTVMSVTLLIVDVGKYPPKRKTKKWVM